MKKVLFIATFFIAGFALNMQSVQSATLLQYGFTSSFAPTFVATDTVGVVVYGNTMASGTIASTARGNNSYATSASPFASGDPVISVGPANGAISSSSALTSSSFMYFSITPREGMMMTLNNLTFNAARGGAATPRGYAVRSSRDNYTADLGNADLATQRPTWTNVVIDLSSTTFKNVTGPVIFKIYVYAPASANVVDFDDFTIDGTVTTAGGINGGIKTLPANPVGLYWDSYNDSGRLVTVATSSYNVIFLFNATPTSSHSGVEFPAPAGAANATNLNADIATLRARRQIVLLTVGGANATTTLTNLSQAEELIASIKAINVQLGGSGQTAVIDGVDFNNFEGITANGPLLTYIGQSLKAFYGNQFIITSPPAASYGLAQFDTDRTAMATMYAGGALDWMSPQFYDSSDLVPPNGDLAVRTVLGTSTDGFRLTENISGVSTTIPQNHIGIGFQIGASTSTQWTTAGATSTYLHTVASSTNPKGGMNFAASLNTSSSFGNIVGAVITNNPRNTSIKTLNGIANASVQTINGIIGATVRLINNL